MGKKVFVKFASRTQFAIQMYDYATQVGQTNHINSKMGR